MGNETRENGSVENKIGNRFDEILGRHVKRLLGARYGIGGLPVTINAISCIILLAEQVKNEKRGIARSEQYTRQMLCDGLTEMCLDADEVMDMIIPDMIHRGYIQIDPDRGIFIKEHTVRMAQLFDYIFPEMPGINLVAYLAQAMDEVKSGRKSLETAGDHFDQTLKIHGVALKKRQTPEKQKEISAPADRQKALKREREILASLTESRRFTRSKVIKGSDADALYQKSVTGAERAPVPSSDVAASSPGGRLHRDKKRKSGKTQPSELSTGGNRLLEIQENRPAETGSVAYEGDGIREPLKGIAETAGHDTATPDISSQVLSGKSHLTEKEVSPEKALHDLPLDHEKTSSSPEAEIQAHPSSPEGTLKSEKYETVQTADAKSDEKTGKELDVPPGEGIPEGDDDVIEREITAFEEGLAMQCPICRIADIKSQETSTGKFYYVCSDKNCTFISWGKPYHLACPECDNPFLVESSAGDGKTILKCPRSTCPHWQRHPSDTSGEDNRRDLPSPRVSRGTTTERPPPQESR